jgi:hypothetical protein
MTRTRGLALAALVVALLSGGASGFAVWRTYDEDEAAPTTTTTRQTLPPATGGPTTTPTSTAVPVGVVTVPSQAGRDALVAVEQLRRVGLEAKISRKPSTTVARNRVVDQRPVEGTRVPTGTVIELFLSSGPP